MHRCDICGASGKNRYVYFHRKTNQYLCSKHRNQYYTYGHFTDSDSRTIFDKNDYIIKEDHAEIVLRDLRYNIVGFVLIDLEDVDKCKKYKWGLSRTNGYVVSYPGKKVLLFHRYILDYTGKLDIDHINRNKLDNRKQNLRIVHKCVNSANKACKGVRRANQKEGWETGVVRYGKLYYLGTFRTFDEALAARQAKIKELEENDEQLLKEYLEHKEDQPTGVRKTPYNTWTAIFYTGNTKHYVGTFKTKEEAVEARALAKERIKMQESCIPT